MVPFGRRWIVFLRFVLRILIRWHPSEFLWDLRRCSPSSVGENDRYNNSVFIDASLSTTFLLLESYLPSYKRIVKSFGPRIRSYDRTRSRSDTGDRWDFPWTRNNSLPCLEDRSLSETTVYWDSCKKSETCDFSVTYTRSTYFWIFLRSDRNSTNNLRPREFCVLPRRHSPYTFLTSVGDGRDHGEVLSRWPASPPSTQR